MNNSKITTAARGSAVAVYNISLMQQVAFHKHAIKEVKDRLGKDCKFLSHLNKKGAIWFLAKVVIKGEDQIIRIDTGKKQASELSAEDYAALKNQLSDYVSGRRNI